MTATNGTTGTTGERVHFSRRSGAHIKADEEGSFRVIRVGAMVLGVFMLGMTVLARAWGASIKAVGERAMSVVVFAGIGVALIWTMWAGRARRRRERDLPETPDDSFRLRCVGTPEEVAQYGELADVPFEPKIFNMSLSVPFSGGMTTVWVATLACALLVGTLVWRTTMGASSCSSIQVVAIPAPLAAEAVIMLFWPAYFRIVPGRLDVLRWRPFRRRAEVLASWDLCVARILVDLRKAVVILDGPNCETPCVFNIGLVRGRARLAHALFLGAISTHWPPPLPDDELLG